MVLAAAGRVTVGSQARGSSHDSRNRAYLQKLQERNQLLKQQRQEQEQQLADQVKREQSFNCFFGGANAPKSRQPASRSVGGYSVCGNAIHRSRSAGAWGQGAWEERTVEIKGCDGEIIALRPSGERKAPRAGSLSEAQQLGSREEHDAGESSHLWSVEETDELSRTGSMLGSSRGATARELLGSALRASDLGGEQVSASPKLAPNSEGPTDLSQTLREAIDGSAGCGDNSRTAASAEDVDAPPDAKQDASTDLFASPATPLSTTQSRLPPRPRSGTGRVPTPLASTIRLETSGSDEAPSTEAPPPAEASDTLAEQVKTSAEPAKADPCFIPANELAERIVQLPPEWRRAVERIVVEAETAGGRPPAPSSMDA